MPSAMLHLKTTALAPVRTRCARAVSAAACGLAVCLSLHATRASAQQFYDHVVIVLDASGSMDQPMRDRRTRKMDAAKAAIKTVLATVPPSTRIGLLVFSAHGQGEEWVFPLGPRNDAAMTQALNRIQPGSSTPLGAFIKKGADRLLAERAAQFGYGTYRLLIVTDGEAQDTELVNRYTPEAMARGITIDVIGVAMRNTHTLATKVHSYRRADDPQALNRALREIFAEVGGPGKDAALGNAFELIAPIPAELAGAMLQALATSGNQPLGSRPSPRTAPRTTPARPAATALAPPAPKRPPSPPHPPAPPSRAESRPTVFFILGAILLAAGVFLVGIVIAVVMLVKSSQRRARR
ncbi:MAG: VWA domain-containing protein [Verrucomicrobia bacterium]|nr:VWA domain-containing protein [Verrucomicrobiota bacterium]